MKIALIARRFPNRSETFIRDHAMGLARRGHRVTVVSGRPGQGLLEREIEELEREGVELEYAGSLREVFRACGSLVRKPSLIRVRPGEGLEYIFAALVRQVLERLRPDLVHVHFGTTARALYRPGLTFPAVVSWHGYDANIMPRKQGGDMYHPLFQAPWRHTVGSEFMRQRLLSLGAKEEQISLIPMGVDLGRFICRERDGRQGLPLRVISVGRLVEEKGHSYLIKAVSELLDAGFAIQLNIIGDGPLRKELNAQIAHTGHAASIQLAGSKTSDEILVELHKADVFCLTGVVAESGGEEGQGVVFAEAQATGLPVIGASVGGIAESMACGESGLLCVPGDVGSIKKAIMFFIENPIEVQEFTRRGRIFVEEKFSLEKMLDRFEQTYRCELMNSSIVNTPR